MRRILAFLPILLTLSVQASAQEPRMGWDKEYGKVSGWSIGFNSKRGHCLAAATYNGGMVFFMGVDNVRQQGVIGFFNEQWGDITDGNTYQIQYRFGRRRWNGPTTGATTRFGKGYYAENLKVEFLRNIAQSGSMEIRRGKRRLGRFSLRGTRNALNATIECQTSVLRKQQAIAEQRRQQRQDQAQTFSGDLLGARLKKLSSGGVMVRMIAPNTVASRMDLLPGDIITHIQGQTINSSSGIMVVIRSHQGKEALQLSFRRNGIDRQASVKEPLASQQVRNRSKQSDYTLPPTKFSEPADLNTLVEAIDQAIKRQDLT